MKVYTKDKKMRCVLKIQLLIVFIFLYSSSFAADIKKAENSDIVKYEEQLRKWSSISEAEIDIGLLSLELAKEIYPELDINKYNAKIDEMVSDAKKLTKEKDDPDFHIRALNTYLFKVKGIEYDLSDPLGEKPENRFLVGPIDKGKGNCVSLPILYITIAQRLGFPVFAVTAPDHLFARYVDKSLKMQNIEPTGQGGFSPNSKYMEDLNISQQAIDNGAYLKTLSNREFLGELIAQNGVFWAKKGDIDRAIKYFHVAKELAPSIPENYFFLGNLHLQKSKEDIAPLVETASFSNPYDNLIPKVKTHGIASLEALNNSLAPNYNHTVDPMENHNREMRKINAQTKNHHIMVGKSYIRKSYEMGLVRLSREEYAKNVLGKYYKKEMSKIKKQILDRIPSSLSRQGSILD
jgi:regulator of sirC expression with transglutaminase-like and TPR domain